MNAHAVSWTPSPAWEMARQSVRVALVDDHRIVREGVRRILETAADLEIVGEAQDGHGALGLIRRTLPDVAVLDLNLPGVSGMNLVRRVRQEHPRTALLVLSMHDEQEFAMRALKAGAQGYLSKDVAAEELLGAVRKVAAGGCHLSRSMAERVALLLAHQGDGPRHEQLTDREFEVFRLIVSGQRISDIAQALHLSVKTVSTHKSRLLQKMGLETTAALIRYGLEHRLFAQCETSPEQRDQARRPKVVAKERGTPMPGAAHTQATMEF